MCNSLTDIYAFDNSTDKITTHSPMIQCQYGPIDCHALKKNKTDGRSCWVPTDMMYLGVSRSDFK